MAETVAWKINNEYMSQRRFKFDGWRDYQVVEFEFTYSDNTVQQIFGYYDDGIAALFTVKPENVDFDSDELYDFESADSPVWRGYMFPADNLHCGDCDFYTWEVAEILDIIVRLYDINKLKSRVSNIGVFYL